MCHTAILPTTLQSDQVNTLILRMIYVFNRWIKMLKTYGRLDTISLNNDFSVISKVIKSPETKKEIKAAVAKCRDLALTDKEDLSPLMKSLRNALELMCNEQEDKSIKEIKQTYADQGMTERYRPLSKRFERETIHRLGRTLKYTNVQTDSPETTKLVRRFVEKRAAQTVHKNFGKSKRHSNRYRQSVRRAVSFSLYNATFTEYDIQKRAPGTHWKVVNKPCKGKKMLKGKHSYLTYEEALEACINFALRFPDDPHPMVPYKCQYCGKWHIGHDRTVIKPKQQIDFDIYQAN